MVGGEGFIEFGYEEEERSLVARLIFEPCVPFFFFLFVVAVGCCIPCCRVVDVT